MSYSFKPKSTTLPAKSFHLRLDLGQSFVKGGTVEIQGVPHDITRIESVYITHKGTMVHLKARKREE